MSRFEKVSKEQFYKDCSYADYEAIKLPKRATKHSAGYDFFSPISFTLYPRESIKFPTGIRVALDNEQFLLIAPRSGLGFKYRLQIDNTIGIIDADYYGSDNEGHIWLKFTNDSKDGKVVEVKAGDAVAQGIILSYSITEDDDTVETRNGGFGSTDKHK